MSCGLTFQNVMQLAAVARSVSIHVLVLSVRPLHTQYLKLTFILDRILYFQKTLKSEIVNLNTRKLKLLLLNTQNNLKMLAD